MAAMERQQMRCPHPRPHQRQREDASEAGPAVETAGLQPTTSSAEAARRMLDELDQDEREALMAFGDTCRVAPEWLDEGSLDRGADIFLRFVSYFAFRSWYC
jgi:hypothetical protein